MAETGAKGPTLEDVISLILEDILGQASDTSASTTVRRHRALHEHRTARAVSSSSAHTTIRRGRSLRSSHPMTNRRKRALRSHHLPFNRFTRPKRSSKHHRRLASSVVGDLLDSLAITGGYDGNQIFFKVELDISKEVTEGLDTIIEKPLELLSEVSFLTDLFGTGSSTTSAFSFAADISMTAGAHLGVMGEYLKSLCYQNASYDSRTFISVLCCSYISPISWF